MAEIVISPHTAEVSYKGLCLLPIPDSPTIHPKRHSGPGHMQQMLIRAIVGNRARLQNVKNYAYIDYILTLRIGPTPPPPPSPSSWPQTLVQAFSILRGKHCERQELE